jgi:AcrR family transcriptional regulator
MQYLSRRLSMESKRSRSASPDSALIAARQRERLLDATERLVAELGFSATAIDRISREARVSTVSFYEHFADKEECFLAAFDRAFEDARGRLAAAVPTAAPWPDQIREALRALLALVAEHPNRARMCLVEAPVDGPALRARYEEMLDSAVPKLREGRAFDASADALAESLEEATIGGLAFLLHQRLQAGGAEGIEETLPQLLDIALSPYLGPREALGLSSAARGG